MNTTQTISEECKTYENSLCNEYDMTEEDFYEIQNEEQNEELYAMENNMDPIYWCKACKIGICMNPYHE